MDAADNTTVRQEAHTIKGSALQVGAARLADSVPADGNGGPQGGAFGTSPALYRAMPRSYRGGARRDRRRPPAETPTAHRRTMANETILIVDDAPVSLKLTDILLRKEGYRFTPPATRNKRWRAAFAAPPT